jgi:plasmid stabilization system protein ParE
VQIDTRIEERTIERWGWAREKVGERTVYESVPRYVERRVRQGEEERWVLERIPPPEPNPPETDVPVEDAPAWDRGYLDESRDRRVGESAGVAGELDVLDAISRAWNDFRESAANTWKDFLYSISEPSEPAGPLFSVPQGWRGKRFHLGLKDAIFLGWVASQWLGARMDEKYSIGQTLEEFLDERPGLDNALTVANNIYEFGGGAVLQFMDDMTFGLVSRVVGLEMENGSKPFQNGRRLGRAASDALGVVEIAIGLKAMTDGMAAISATINGGAACAVLTEGGCLAVVAPALVGESALVGVGALATAHGGLMLMRNRQEHLRSTGSQSNATRKLRSRIGEDPRLVREAERAAKSHQESLNRLVDQLRRGNMNPGIGTKRILGNIFEARARDGARVYFRIAEDGTIEILAKSSKQNQSRVINILQEIYGP